MAMSAALTLLSRTRTRTPTARCVSAAAAAYVRSSSSSLSTCATRSPSTSRSIARLHTTTTLTLAHHQPYREHAVQHAHGPHPPLTTYEHIVVETSAPHVLRITLNRASLHNAFNAQVIRELTDAFRYRVQPAPHADDHRVVVLQAAGKSFSAGADLNWMKEMRQYTEAENVRDSHHLFDMVNAIYECPVPVIARVQGNALGGGVGLVAACDIAVALESAVFGLTEVRLGLAPAVISRFVMQKIGFAEASRYFLTAERFDAAAAHRMQLVTSVVPTVERLDAEVDALTRQIVQNGPHAVRKTKQLIRYVQRAASVAETKEYVCKTIASLRVGAEGQEGLSAFFEKRDAAWNQPPKAAAAAAAAGTSTHSASTHSKQ